MGMPCFVFHHIHPMLGLDLENCIIPPAPAVIPYTPYMSATVLSGSYISAKMTKKTYALSTGIRIMQKGTDCGYLGVLHFGNPANALYPLILVMSKSKSHFAVASVKMEGTPVATAIVFVGINLNCGTISTPFGMVLPPTTVFAGMTIGDVIAGFFNIAVDIAWDLIAKKIFGFKKISSRLAEKIFGKIAPTIIRRLLPELDDIAKDVVKRTLEKLLKKYFFEEGMKRGIGAGRGKKPDKGAGGTIEEKVRENEAWRRHFETAGEDSF